MFRYVLLSLLWLTCVSAGDSKGVQSFSFKTRAHQPIYKVPARLKEHEDLFRLGLGRLPEGWIVGGGLLLGSADMGLSPRQQEELMPLITDAYNKLYRDPVFARLKSALPYCFSRKRRKRGHYFVSYPRDSTPNAPCFVFLHGYGGNFMLWTWLMRAEFPGAIVLCPSWGVSWRRGPIRYLRDMLRDQEKRLGRELPKPWLFGISDGGVGASKVYSLDPERYRGLVCIAAAHDANSVHRLKPDMRMAFINGTDDPNFPIEHVEKRVVAVKKRVNNVEFIKVTGSHYFVLSNRKKTFDEIRRCLK